MRYRIVNELTRAANVSAPGEPLHSKPLVRVRLQLQPATEVGEWDGLLQVSVSLGAPLWRWLLGLLTLHIPSAQPGARSGHHLPSEL